MVEVESQKQSSILLNSQKKTRIVVWVLGIIILIVQIIMVLKLFFF